MFDFYQRRKLKGILYLPVVRILFFVIAVLMLVSAYHRYEVAAEMAERRENAEKDLSELHKHKEQLEEKVKYLQDDRGIEAELRRQFDVALPGEEVIVIVEKESDVEPIPVRTATEAEPAWYQFWR